MQLTLRILSTNNPAAVTDAFLVVGAVAGISDRNFERYMDHFGEFLIRGLQNHTEYHVCATAVGVVGDVCRALDADVTKYCDTFVTLLLRNLEAQHLHRSVKPPVLCVFGDIALAIGPSFEKYVNVVMSMLQQAGKTTVSGGDEDLLEYLNCLREAILESTTGIIQGLHDGGTGSRVQCIRPFLDDLFFLLDQISKDTLCETSVIRAGVGVVGDIVHAFGPEVLRTYPHDFIRPLIDRCISSHDEAAVETARWTQSLM